MKLADAIDYCVPVLYDHFQNKEAILLEFGKQGYELLFKKLEAAKKKSEDPGEQLKAMAVAYWNFAFKNKEYYQLMFGLGIECCETEKCIVESTPFRELVQVPIEKVLEQNNRKNVNSCLKYHTFWSILHGLISIKMLNNPDVADELNKMVLDDAMDGFVKNLKQ
jgi:AcrR family transcriptional regulator